MIYLTGREDLTNSDILNDTRLSSIPYNGQLTVQTQANENIAADFFTITIQLPDGKVPVDAQRITSGRQDDVLGGNLDIQYLTQFTFPAAQGGHFTISFVKAGTGTVIVWRVVLRP